jgi:hypothetical protein
LKENEMSQDHSLWADSVTIAEITQLRAALVELMSASEPFTDPDIVDETDGTIPLMDRLEEALTRCKDVLNG